MQNQYPQSVFFNSVYHVMHKMFYNCTLFQRIGKYDQHSAEQLNLDQSPVEYLQVNIHSLIILTFGI